MYDGDERRLRDFLSTKETPGFDFGVRNNKLVSIPVLVVSILSPYFPNIDTVVVGVVRRLGTPVRRVRNILLQREFSHLVISRA